MTGKKFLEFLRGQSITLLLALVIVAILLVAAWVGTWMTSRYEHFVNAFRQEQVDEWVPVKDQDLPWHRHIALGNDLAQSTASNKDLA